MKNLAGAAEPPEGNPVSHWNGTAWCGWCPNCGVPFGNHNVSCSQVVRSSLPVTTTTTTVAYPPSTGSVVTTTLPAA